MDPPGGERLRDWMTRTGGVLTQPTAQHWLRGVGRAVLLLTVEEAVFLGGGALVLALGEAYLLGIVR